MVSVHSTYTDSHTHGHHHAKKRKKSVVRNDPDLLTRTSWVDASVAYAQILKVNKNLTLEFSNSIFSGA